MHNSWFFRHFNKIFTTVFIVVMLFILAQFAIVIWAGVQVVDRVESGSGLRGAVEEIWCGAGNQCLFQDSETE
jgi:hypothetical protein